MQLIIENKLIDDGSELYKKISAIPAEEFAKFYAECYPKFKELNDEFCSLKIWITYDEKNDIEFFMLVGTSSTVTSLDERMKMDNHIEKLLSGRLLVRFC